MFSLTTPPHSAGKEENKPTAANQASYGTKPETLIFSLWLAKCRLPCMHCFQPGEKHLKRLNFLTDFFFFFFKSSWRRQPGEDFISWCIYPLAKCANRSIAKKHWMNFAWTDCCEWDSSLLLDYSLSFGLGLCHGSLFYFMDAFRPQLEGSNCMHMFSVAYATALLILKSTGKLTGY